MNNFIKIHNYPEPISLTDILYLKSDWNYTKIYLCNGNILLSCRTLGYHILHNLSSHFVRIHRGVCINQIYVQGYEIGSDYSFVRLHGGEELPLSRRRKADVIRKSEIFIIDSQNLKLKTNGNL